MTQKELPRKSAPKIAAPILKSNVALQCKTELDLFVDKNKQIWFANKATRRRNSKLEQRTPKPRMQMQSASDRRTRNCFELETVEFEPQIELELAELCALSSKLAQVALSKRAQRKQSAVVRFSTEARSRRSPLASSGACLESPQTSD